jgi:hypothetical protein
MSARGENRPEASRKPGRGLSNRPGQAGYFRWPFDRSNVRRCLFGLWEIAHAPEAGMTLRHSLVEGWRRA